MIKLALIPVDQSDLLALIHFAFLGDSDLVDKYQAEPRSFRELVDYTYGEIVATMENPVFAGDVHLYKVAIANNSIGYCVLVINGEKPHMLLSYGINKEFRKGEILTEWLALVAEKLGEPYYTCNWKQNIRSIKFLEKNNFEIIDNPGKPFVYAVKGDSSVIKSHVLCR